MPSRASLPRCLLVCALFLAGAAGDPARAVTPASAAVNEQRDDGETWYRLVGPHFELFGQAPVEQLETFALELEQLHGLLERLGADPRRYRPPLTIFALEREQLRSLGPRGGDLGPRDNRITGYFVSAPLGDAIVFERDPESTPRETLFHEYLHAFVRHHLPAAPLWLNEGLAEYYSTFELARDRDGTSREPASRARRRARPAQGTPPADARA